MMKRLEPSPRKPATCKPATSRTTPQPAVRPATAPRPVAGPEGGRISLQMGKSGDEYLLLLDEDDGDDEWQTRSSSSVPDDLVTQLDRLQAANPNLSPNPNPNPSPNPNPNRNHSPNPDPHRRPAGGEPLRARGGPGPRGRVVRAWCRA